MRTGSIHDPPYYLTAYGLAVKHGYTGTEEEWLASLQGHDAYTEAVNAGYGGTEEEFYAALADIEDAVTDAEAAQSAAETAQGKAELAQSAAETAQGKAELAQSAAEDAQSEAEIAKSTAVSSAATATSKAGEATAAAAEVAGYQQTYSELVTAAENAAAEAESAETSAKAYKTSAEESALAAQAAKTDAEKAQGKAEVAQGNAATSAQTASAAAQTATTAAQSAAQTAAAAVATQLAGYVEDATGAATAAETAQGLAEAAQTAAEAAQDAAEAAAESLDADTLARIDGYYEDMTVGQTEQMLSTQTHVDKVPYLFRPTAGRADVGSVIGGNRARESITGGTVAWNQLCPNGDFSSRSGWIVSDASATEPTDHVLTFTAETTGQTPSVRRTTNPEASGYVPFEPVTGRVYFGTFDAKGSGSLGMSFDTNSNSYNTVKHFETLSSDWQTFCGVMTYEALEGHTPAILISGYGNAWTAGMTASIRNVMVIDLTLMFGPAIAAQILSLESGVAGAGVDWFRKLFPVPYYAYNAGELVSVSGLQSHDTVGFNAYDPDSGTAQLVGGVEYQITGDYTALSLGGVTVTPDEDGKFTPATGGELTVTGGNATTTCVHLVWSGSRDDEYEEYDGHSYPLDSALTLRGVPRLDANNSLYYNGDEYAPDGTVTRRYAIVDLGDLSWTYQSDTTAPVPFFRSQVMPFATRANLVTSKYPRAGYTRGDLTDKTCAMFSTSGNRLCVADADYTDAATFSAAVSGVMLVYELDTPTTESAEPYAAYQIVDDWGTEQYVSTPQTGLPALPVGHVTEYQTINMRDKLQHLPFLSDSGDGNYTVQQTGSQMALVPNTAPGRLDAVEAKLPAPPSADGTYRLTVTVSGGAATYSWEV